MNKASLSPSLSLSCSLAQKKQPHNLHVSRQTPHVKPLQLEDLGYSCYVMTHNSVSCDSGCTCVLCLYMSVLDRISSKKSVVCFVGGCVSVCTLCDSICSSFLLLAGSSCLYSVTDELIQYLECQSPPAWISVPRSKPAESRMVGAGQPLSSRRPLIYLTFWQDKETQCQGV